MSLDMSNPFSIITDHLESTAAFNKILNGAARPGTETTVRNLAGSSRAFMLASLFRKTGQPVIAITESLDTADDLREDMVNILGEEHVDYFPCMDGSYFQEKGYSVEKRIYRMLTYRSMLNDVPKVTVVPVRALLEKLPPMESFVDHIVPLTKGTELDFEGFLKTLVAAGYERIPMVEQYGEFSVRGGLVDIFPLDSDNPIRIEFWGDEIESIRSFDLASQRSLADLDAVTITPFREIVKVLPEQDELPAKVSDAFYERMSVRFLDHKGVEQYLPLLFKTTAGLLDYAPKNAVLFLDDAQRLKWESEFVLNEAERDHDRKADKQHELPVTAAQLYRTYNNLLDDWSGFARLTLIPAGADADNPAEFNATAQAPASGRLDMFKKKLKVLQEDGFSAVIYSDTPKNVARLSDLFEHDDLPVTISVGNICNGFILKDANLSVYTDREVFHRVHTRFRSKKFKGGIPIESYRTLDKGDYVVHMDYGIGKYMGIEHVQLGAIEKECLNIFYKNEDRILVPVDQLNRVHKFIGGEHSPPLVHSLNGNAWEKAKAKTKKAIEDMAGELLQLYAERKRIPGISYAEDTDWQKELEASFPYEETRDQLRALKEVNEDLARPAPMDRLVCGDVGFGKTEIAVRAAFKVLSAGKQVAVLVPTTILAQQHLNTFRERMSKFPVTVDMLSRFRSKKEQAETIKSLKNGKVDVIVGTHRLLSTDIEFADLGLLVVDEEQLFGVKHKEKIKRLRNKVDVLTMTATPIPRTLHMSLMGVRDMSIVNTAPKGRMPIQTNVMEFNKEMIAAAIMKEVGRGGQVYFVHNRVQSLPGMYTFLQKLLPEIRIGVGHGQMKNTELEEVMLNFMDRKYDVLLCTMIIESGLDIPNVNTIIVNRADCFGLSQLYQLRGRVGRSSQKAYAHLVIPPWGTLDTIARKRLTTLQEFSDLGAGFKIANRDLEIRGAGNMLGRQQHGFANTVGFDMYCQMLEETVAEMNGLPVEKKTDSQLKIPVSAFIPSSYVMDPHQKVNLYYRLADVKTDTHVHEIGAELEDRYGRMPGAVKALLKLVRLKLMAQKLQLSVIQQVKDRVILTFDPDGNELSKDMIGGLVKRAVWPFEVLTEDGIRIKAQVYGKNNMDKLDSVITFVKSLVPAEDPEKDVLQGNSPPRSPSLTNREGEELPES